MKTDKAPDGETGMRARASTLSVPGGEAGVTESNAARNAMLAGRRDRAGASQTHPSKRGAAGRARGAGNRGREGAADDAACATCATSDDATGERRRRRQTQNQGRRD
jgi:hypothetical protein